MGMRSFYFLMAKRFNLEMYIFVLILFVFRKQGRKNSAAASFQTERRRPSSCTTSTQKRAMQPAGCASKTTRATSSSIALQADHQENESSFTKITSLFQPSSRTTIHKVCLSFSPKQRNKQLYLQYFHILLLLQPFLTVLFSVQPFLYHLLQRNVSNKELFLYDSYSRLCLKKAIFSFRWGR